MNAVPATSWIATFIHVSVNAISIMVNVTRKLTAVSGTEKQLASVPMDTYSMMTRNHAKVGNN